jgi:GABA permease
VQEETVERMDEEGIDAAGDTGESDPLLAIRDALTTFPADEIVLFTHAGRERNWLEEGLVDQVKERFDAPVQHLVIEADYRRAAAQRLRGSIRASRVN